MDCHTKIDPRAVVEKGALIGKGVVIEPYATVKKNVTLKDGVTIKSYAYIDGHTTIGENSTIWPGASIGTKTQDLKYQGEITYVEIGESCDIREYVTINSSCGEGTKVKVGNHCLIMASSHIAHNCILGNHIIMANNAVLAGHVEVEDFAIIGGMTPVHQYSRIGTYAMVGGFSRVTHDIPPYTIGAGSPYKIGGLNLVGLKRHNMPYETRLALAKAFKIIYRSKDSFNESLKKLETECDLLIPEVAHWLKFCQSTKRGLINLDGKGSPDSLVEDKETLIKTGP